MSSSLSNVKTKRGAICHFFDSLIASEQRGEPVSDLKDEIPEDMRPTEINNAKDESRPQISDNKKIAANKKEIANTNRKNVKTEKSQKMAALSKNEPNKKQTGQPQLGVQTEEKQKLNRRTQPSILKKGDQKEVSASLAALINEEYKRYMYGDPDVVSLKQQHRQQAEQAQNEQKRAAKSSAQKRKEMQSKNFLNSSFAALISQYQNNESLQIQSERDQQAGVEDKNKQNMKNDISNQNFTQNQQNNVSFVNNKNASSSAKKVKFDTKNSNVSKNKVGSKAVGASFSNINKKYPAISSNKGLSDPFQKIADINEEDAFKPRPKVNNSPPKNNEAVSSEGTRKNKYFPAEQHKIKKVKTEQESRKNAQFGAEKKRNKNQPLTNDSLVDFTSQHQSQRAIQKSSLRQHQIDTKKEINNQLHQNFVSSKEQNSPMFPKIKPQIQYPQVYFGDIRDNARTMPVKALKIYSESSLYKPVTINMIESNISAQTILHLGHRKNENADHQPECPKLRPKFGFLKKNF